MERLRTNNNKYRAAIEDYILSCIESEDQELKTAKEKINHFFDRFNGEFNEWNKGNFPNEQERVAAYLQGLPFGFAFTNNDIIKLAENLHDVDELTGLEIQTVLEQYWTHLAYHILRLKEKYGKV